MNRSHFHIGVYCLAPYARTERHIREIAECGIDFVTCMGYDRAALDLFSKYGLSAIVSGVVPGWFGGDGSNAGTMQLKNPLERYRQAAETFADHPAIWGIDAGDEPSALDFAHYGEVIRLVDRLFPRAFAYMNLYPAYGLKASGTEAEIRRQLGTDTYAEYIERYIQSVSAEYLSLDCYVYSSTPDVLYHTLSTAATACRRSGRSLWTVLQVNSHDSEKWIRLNQLRFQGYAALCYGAEVIQWACYTAGWWHHQVLDEHGEKTQQYAKLQTVNAELKRIGEVRMRFDCLDTQLIEKTPWSAGVFESVHTVENRTLLAGYMTERVGDGQALMLCAADDPIGENGTGLHVRFRCMRPVRVLDADGERLLAPQTDGSYELFLPSCSGALVMA